MDLLKVPSVNVDDLKSTAGTKGAAMVGYGSGTVNDAITGINNLTLWKTVDTIAQMTALLGSVYSHVKVRGYLTAGDGGGGEFAFQSGSTAVVDNGIIFYDSTNGTGRYVRDVISGRVNVNWFGALPNNGATDSTAGIIAADAYAHTKMGLIYFPSGAGAYRVTSRITINCRGMDGDADYADSVNNGTLVNFSPNVPLNTVTAIGTPTSIANDNLACFRLIRNDFKVSNLTVSGNVGYNLATLVQDGFWTGGQLNQQAGVNYSSLGYGFVGFEAYSGGAGIFTNCHTYGLKHGLLLNNNIGHVSWYNCQFNGYTGVHCALNNQDYFQELGGCGGTLAGVSCSDTSGIGGFTSFRIIRAHIGFSPFGFLQFHDSVNNGVANLGWDLELIGCSWEQIGEAYIWSLPGKINNLSILGGSASMSSVAADITPGGWAYILPANMVPVVGSQQFNMRLGALQKFSVKSTGFKTDIYYPTGNTWSYAVPVGTNYFLQVDFLSATYGPYTAGNDPFNFGAIGNSVLIGTSTTTAANYNSLGTKSASIPRPDTNISPYPASLGDLRRHHDLSVDNNLLMNPEVLSNWTQPTGSVSTQSLLSALVAAGTITESMIPGALRETLGDDPMVLVVTNAASTNAGPTLPLVNNPVSILNRYVSFNYWVLITSNATTSVQVSARINAANAVYPFANFNYVTPGRFVQMTYEEYAAAARGNVGNSYYSVGLGYVSTTNNEVMYICGVMLNKGRAVSYNPYSGPYGTNVTLVNPTLTNPTISNLTIPSTGIVMPDGYTLASTPIGRNKIINGNCNIAQRPAWASTTGWSYYGGPDRFIAQLIGAEAGAFIQSQGTLTYNGIVKNAVVQTVTTPITDLSGNNTWCGIEQRIEGYNAVDMINKPIAISFIFNTNVTGVFCVGLQDMNGNRCVSTFNAIANISQKVIVLIPALSTFTAPNTNAIGAYVTVGFLNQGTNVTSTLNTWQRIGSCATTATNWGATVGNYISLTELQVEVGLNATPFENRPAATEWVLCQRYYQSIVIPASQNFMNASTISATVAQAYGSLPGGAMRATPSATLSSALTGSFSGTLASNPTLTLVNNGIYQVSAALTGATPGYAGYVTSNASGTTLGFNAEI